MTGFNTAAGAGNVIADNGQAGVAVGTAGVASIRVALTRNALVGNGGLGIDLAPQGTVNCATPSPGPNDYTPCPVITRVTTAQVSGTACTRCTVEVYRASAEADDEGHGEGQTWLGSASAGADGSWSLALAGGQVAVGQRVTASATTTGAGAESSEFAANVVVGP